jgi:hypothetical protein
MDDWATMGCINLISLCTRNGGCVGCDESQKSNSVPWRPFPGIIRTNIVLVYGTFVNIVSHETARSPRDGIQGSSLLGKYPGKFCFC